MDFPRGPASCDLHAPKPTTAVEVSAIRNVENLAPIARPVWADFSIKLAVVVAGKRALVLARYSLNIGEFAICKIAGENVKALIVGSRDKDNLLPVGRKPRLNVDGPAGRKLLRVQGLKIKHP